MKQPSLKADFLIPPFSVLDMRQGYWKERKKLWQELIQDKGETRENCWVKPGSGNSKFADQFAKLHASILCPVLCEAVVQWFGVPNGKTFDCFAGGVQFGYVSGHLGNEYTGIELRQEQVEANNKRRPNDNVRWICDDGRNLLNHIQPKSQDLFFSCPPYYGVEKYSDLPNDANNQPTYEGYLDILSDAFTKAVKCLKHNRFAVVVIGDARGKNGAYLDIPCAVKSIFRGCGMHLVNDMVLMEPVGLRALMARTNMDNRKCTKVHQNVLVFYKGNPQTIHNFFSEVKVDEYALGCLTEEKEEPWYNDL